MKVLGVLDGRDMPDDLLKAWADSAEFVIAADGAAELLLRLGVTPNIVIGDMDTFAGDIANLNVLRVDGTDSTDCDKLLRWVAESDCGQFTLASVEGDLPDHVMATFSSCVSFGRNVRIALRRGVGWVFSGPLDVRATRGTRVSLMPLSPTAGVTLSGVQWPLNDAELMVGGLVSISNEAREERIQVSIEHGTGFLFVEYPRREMPFWE